LEKESTDLVLGTKGVKQGSLLTHHGGKLKTVDSTGVCKSSQKQSKKQGNKELGLAKSKADGGRNRTSVSQRLYGRWRSASSKMFAPRAGEFWEQVEGTKEQGREAKSMPDECCSFRDGRRCNNLTGRTSKNSFKVRRRRGGNIVEE